VLGAKKVQKLGAKKITSDVIDFDEAEKKAKEEAERIEKLGYDPEAEEEANVKQSGKGEASNIISPTPVSPSRTGYGSGHSREKSASEIERLGMGVARLGFGQVGGGKPAASAAQKKSGGGFGSVGPIKANTDGKTPLPELQLPKYRPMLTFSPRRREVCEVQVWQPEGDFIGRVLRQGLLRPQRAVRGEEQAAGIRRRLGHLVQRLLRPPRGRGRRRGVRRPGDRREGLCPEVWNYRGRRPGEFD